MFGSPSWCMKARGVNKRHKVGVEGIKLYLFTDDNYSFCLKIPIEATKSTAEIKSVRSQDTRSIHKNQLHFYRLASEINFKTLKSKTYN